MIQLGKNQGCPPMAGLVLWINGEVAFELQNGYNTSLERGITINQKYDSHMSLLELTSYLGISNPLQHTTWYDRIRINSMANIYLYSERVLNIPHLLLTALLGDEGAYTLMSPETSFGALRDNNNEMLIQHP